jgi:alkanesulfonate monooxygenase SsuD/methylene tetrahydromethanopterin reductase-like flavin-dependent oxidoreductase (luciferase family)
VRIGVLVAALARRRPQKVAREAATLDLLSGGRVVFGAGLGSLPDLEHAAFGEDPTDRVRAEKLDEALEIVTDLWSGAPFAYDGRHHKIAEAVFVPPPSQLPRIPVWIGGRWPNRRPFRRAARWDGVFPTHRDVGFADNMAPATLREIVAYTRAHRTASGPFDVVLEASSGAEPERDADLVAAYAEAGLTWWIERAGWWRGPVGEVLARIEKGPPGAAT